MSRFDWCAWLWRVALVAACAFGMNGTARAAFPADTTDYCVNNFCGTNDPKYSSAEAACQPTLQLNLGSQYDYATFVSATPYQGSQTQFVCTRNRYSNSPYRELLNDQWLLVNLITVAPTCPGNATLSGSTCTCSSGYAESTTGGVTTCVQGNTCAPDGTIQDANTTTRYSIPGTGSTACHQGCLVVFEYTNGSGANRWATGPAHSMGLPCTPGGETTPDTTPQTPEQNSCPVGQCPGTVNGASVCVLCSVSHNDVQPPPTGASGVPGTTTTTTVNPDGTVTTETRNPDGTTSSSSSPGQQIGIEAYCTRNPMAFICSGVPGGDTGSAAPGAPGGAASGVPGSAPTITSPNATAAPSTLYTKKYPDGLMGVWNAKREALQNSGLASAITSLVPSFGSGGCPTMDLPGASIMGLQFGGGSVAPPCWVWTMVQAVMMVTALIAARRLIFGG